MQSISATRGDFKPRALRRGIFKRAAEHVALFFEHRHRPTSASIHLGFRLPGPGVILDGLAARLKSCVERCWTRREWADVDRRSSSRFGFDW